METHALADGVAPPAPVAYDDDRWPSLNIVDLSALAYRGELRARGWTESSGYWWLPPAHRRDLKPKCYRAAEAATAEGLR